MLDVIFASVRSTLGNWHQEAGRRRAISGVDPVADTLDYCASEVEAQLRELEDASSWLTVEQYARLQVVTPQTVRNWIARGELAAERTAQGWRIRRTAQRKRRTVRRSA